MCPALDLHSKTNVFSCAYQPCIASHTSFHSSPATSSLPFSPSLILPLSFFRTRKHVKHTRACTNKQACKLASSRFAHGTHGIGAVFLHKRSRIEHVAERLAHLEAVFGDESMREDKRRQRHVCVWERALSPLRKTMVTWECARRQGHARTQ